MKSLILALPKGRILQEILPILVRCDIVPEAEFYDESSRKLRFKTSQPMIEIIRVRSFDIATIVAFGAADLGAAGADVIAEFDYSEVYAPIDLAIGKCRLSLAEPLALPEERKINPARLERISHLRLATKYPEICRRYFAALNIQVEPIKLNGALELAPLLGLCDQIVDLVSSGATLKANGLVEVATLMTVSSRLIVNRSSMKTRPEEISGWLKRINEQLA